MAIKPFILDIYNSNQTDRHGDEILSSLRTLREMSTGQMIPDKKVAAEHIDIVCRGIGITIHLKTQLYHNLQSDCNIKRQNDPAEIIQLLIAKTDRTYRACETKINVTTILDLSNAKPIYPDIRNNCRGPPSYDDHKSIQQINKTLF